MPLRLIAVACHAVLLCALIASILWPSAAAWRFGVAAVLALPLIVARPGLRSANKVTEQRLAVLLVAYIGGASVEVVARAGNSALPSVVLLAAVLELGLLLALIRAPRNPQPDAAG